MSNSTTWTQAQDQGGAPIDRNDPAIDPEVPGQTQQQPTSTPSAGDAEVDQKAKHDDNSNEFSPGFEPKPDRPQPGEETDADIDTDGG